MGDDVDRLAFAYNEQENIRKNGVLNGLIAKHKSEIKVLLNV